MSSETDKLAELAEAADQDNEEDKIIAHDLGITVAELHRPVDAQELAELCYEAGHDPALQLRQERLKARLAAQAQLSAKPRI